MRSGELFLFGLLAALTLVPGISFAAVAEPRAVVPKVQTIQQCTTQRCASKLSKVPTSVKTVSTTAKTTSTKTTYLKTRTIPNTKKVVTKTTTVRPTYTETYSTVTIFIWTRTATRTRWFTVSTTTTTTLRGSEKTTVTRTPATKTILPPSDFTPIFSDRANVGLNKLKKRDPEAQPEPVPEPAPKPVQGYPKAVLCTKTIKTILTATTIKRVGTKTVTLPPRTTWRRVFTGETVYRRTTLKGAPTISSYYEGATSPRGTMTSTSTVTMYPSTVTSWLPTPSFYAACAARNQAPPPGKLMNIDGGYGVGAGTSFPFINFPTNGTAYDCCVACQTLPANKGVCQGSIWQYQDWWGPTPCSFVTDWDCIDPVIQDKASCILVLEGRNKCQPESFDIASPFDWPMAISNGPRCAHWKLSSG